jgi:hypothetical protein
MRKSFAEVLQVSISPRLCKENFYLSHHLITAIIIVTKTIAITITICTKGGWYKKTKKSINIINN